MKKNIWIWLAAFFLAVLLWLQNGLLSEQEEILYVPLRIDPLPKNLVFSNEQSPSIGITLKTKGMNLLLFNNQEAEYVIDGGQLEYGTNSLHLSLNKLQGSHRMLEYVTGFERKVKLISMDKIIITDKPVLINYQSHDDEEYFKKNPIDKRYSVVKVKGASKVLDALEGVQTEKVSRKALQDGKVRVRLQKPGAQVELMTDDIVLRLSGESDIIKTIPLVPISYDSEAGYTITPQKVTVKVVGVQSVLSSVTRNDIIIELVVTPDSDYGSLRFTLPEGIKIKEYTPERVRIIR